MRLRMLLAGSAVVATISSIPVSAASDAKLQAIRGTVGYQTTKDSPFTRVFGNAIVSDNELAITQAASNGMLQLPDSSEVALGASTTIQVGQILEAATAASPATITLVAGALRFAIQHPAGGQSNYRFATTTSQIAVRGTVGLYSTGPNGDVVTCLSCTPGDVAITAGGKTFALLTGQTATISLAGVVTIGATAAAEIASSVSAFTHAGLSVTNSTTAFAPGISSGAAAGTAAATTTAITAGAAAAAVGVGVGIAVSHPSPSPIPVPAAASTAVPIEASATSRAPAAAAAAARPAPMAMPTMPSFPPQVQHVR